MSDAIEGLKNTHEYMLELAREDQDEVAMAHHNACFVTIKNIQRDYILVPREEVPENLYEALQYFDEWKAPAAIPNGYFNSITQAAALLAENGGE